MSTQSNTPQTSDSRPAVFQRLKEVVCTSENMRADKRQQARDKQRKKIMGGDGEATGAARRFRQRGGR